MLPKSIRIQLRFIIMSYKLIYQYPSIILGGFLEATVTLLSFFIFWQIILVDQEFGGWFLKEILIFSSLGYLCWGLASFFFTGVWGLPYKIIEGEIERWLCRPLRHPLLGVLFEDIWVGGGAFLAVSSILITLVSIYYRIQYQLLNILLALIVLVLGMYCLYILYGTLSSFAGFTIGRASFVEEALESMEDNFVRIPATTLGGGIRTFLIVGYPIAFISAFPAEILLEKLDILDSLAILGILIVLSIFWTTMFLLVWRFGINRYESASN